MEIEYAFLADAAQVASDNKLYALGAGIDELRVGGFPALQVALSLVVKLRLHPTEADREHRLEIQIWDQDGKQIAPAVGGGFSAQRRDDAPVRPVYVQTVLNIFGLVFQQPGAHEFHVIVNDQHLKAVPLYVGENPPPPEMAQQESDSS